MIMMKYVPELYSSAKAIDLNGAKSRFKYFSEYYSSKQAVFQALLCSSQILFIVIVFNLASLIRQRISVPEYRSEKGKFYLLILNMLIQILSLFGLVFMNEYSLSVTKRYFGLTDNVLFVLFLVSSSLVCVNTFLLLIRMDIFGTPKESYYLNMKRYLLSLMGICLFHYTFCLLLVSYYHPIIYAEKLLFCALIFLKEANSIVYLLCFLFFVVTLKYDFFYFYLNLNVRPDIEFFVDEDEKDNFLNN